MNSEQLDRYLEVLIERKFGNELSVAEKAEARKELGEHFLQAYNAKVLSKFDPAHLPQIEIWVDSGEFDKISELAYKSSINTAAILAEVMAEFQRQYLGDI